MATSGTSKSSQLAECLGRGAELPPDGMRPTGAGIARVGQTTLQMKDTGSALMHAMVERATALGESTTVLQGDTDYRRPDS